MLNIDNIIQKTDAVKQNNGSYRANCPVCGGKSTTKLVITPDNEKGCLLYCLGGCDFKSIAAELGEDIFMKERNEKFFTNGSYHYNDFVGRKSC